MREGHRKNVRLRKSEGKSERERKKEKERGGEEAESW
jgi:hypothetical protein